MSGQMLALKRLLPEASLEDAVGLLDERGLAKLDFMAKEVASILATFTATPIETDAEEGVMAELISRGNIALRELDSLRRSKVDPLNAEVKAVNGVFKRITKPLEEHVGKGGRADKLIVTYRALKRARIEREQREAQRAQEELARKEAEALAKAETAKTEKARQKARAEAEEAARAQAEALAKVPEQATRGVRTDSGSIKDREFWTFEVVDPAQVPREYLVVDESKIRKAVAAGVRAIAGVNVFPEDRITRRVG